MRWIDRIAFEVTSAWKRFRLMRQCPELRELDRALAAARSKHKPTKEIRKRREQVILGLLRGGV